MASWVQASHGGCSKSLRRQRRPHSPALRKDGATISVEFTIVPLRDEAGCLIGVAAIMRDVSKRFKETRALR